MCKQLTTERTSQVKRDKICLPEPGERPIRATENPARFGKDQRFPGRGLC